MIIRPSRPPSSLSRSPDIPKHHLRFHATVVTTEGPKPQQQPQQQRKQSTQTAAAQRGPLGAQGTTWKAHPVPLMAMAPRQRP